MMARLSGASADVDHPYLRHIAPDVPRVMLALFTSDKGLCGSFNTNLLKKAEEFIREQRALGREVVLVTVGRKGQQHFRRRGIEPSAHFASFTNKSSYADLRPLGTLLANAYTGQSVSEVYMIYARFLSVARNVPGTARLLPVETPKETPAAQTDFRQEFTLEPSPEELLVALLPRYFQTVLFQAAIENFTSENGARMVAMENATKAAGDMIKALTLEYNKARQSGITLELLDIVGGAEALKG
jgi:F-type H+-transporting ATPase subunit gamma